MSIKIRPSGARRHTLPSAQSPRSIFRSIAFTVYPVRTFASGSNTYRAGEVTSGGRGVEWPAGEESTGKLFCDLWARIRPPRCDGAIVHTRRDSVSTREDWCTRESSPIPTRRSRRTSPVNTVKTSTPDQAASCPAQLCERQFEVRDRYRQAIAPRSACLRLARGLAGKRASFRHSRRRDTLRSMLSLAGRGARLYIHTARHDPCG